MELEYAVMEPGDALFFHCNTLHRSDANNSPDPRWSLICCYNAARNNPYKESHHPSYHKLNKVDDNALKQVGVKLYKDQSDFLDLQTDKTSLGRDK